MVAETKGRREKDLKLGLALSGGGFRATAFHLGVLKRLHELGVLERVEVLSTVSGGSITGAFWVWWRAIGHGASPASDIWDEFERRLVHFMRADVRGRTMLWAAVLPAIALSLMVVAGHMLFNTPVVRPSGLALMTVAAVAGGYTGWTLFSGRLLVHYYDRFLFHGAHLAEIADVREEQESKLPRLFVNATVLETAQQVMFTETERIGDVLMEGARRVPVVNIFTGAIELLQYLHERGREPGKAQRTLWRSETFAQAVAASSAVPGIFPPVAVGGAFESFAAAMRRRSPKRFARAKESKRRASRARYLAADGGVFDNQGIQALMEQSCTGIIVSDASAQLLPASGLSMQRKINLLKRTQDIIYARVRQLGYAQVHLLARVYRLMEELRKAGASRQKLTALRESGSPAIAAHCMVELAAHRKADKQLPRSLCPLVAAVRTDLDAFSNLEISALMYQGYATADAEMKKRKVFHSKPTKPLRFETTFTELNRDWPALEEGDLERAKNHLGASHVKLAAWRRCVRAVGAFRIWLSEQQWFVSFKKRAVETWRKISPNWKWVPLATFTIERSDGQREESVKYGWRRRRLLRPVLRWIHDTPARIAGRIRGRGGDLSA